MLSSYGAKGRPARAAATAAALQHHNANTTDDEYSDDDGTMPTPTAHQPIIVAPSVRGGRAGRPRGGKAAGAVARGQGRGGGGAGRGAGGSKQKNTSSSVQSALAKGINRCEQCGIEFYQQPPFAQSSWMWIVYEALRRLHDEGKPHRKYFHYKLDICNYIDRNWGHLCPSKKRTPTWNNTVSAVITTHPKLFKSNRKQSGYWTLKKLTPGSDGSSDEEDNPGAAVADAALNMHDHHHGHHHDYAGGVGLGEHQGGVDVGRMPKSKRQQNAILMQQAQQAAAAAAAAVQHPVLAQMGPITIAPLVGAGGVGGMPGMVAQPTASILSNKKRTHSDMMGTTVVMPTSAAAQAAASAAIVAAPKRRKLSPGGGGNVTGMVSSPVSNNVGANTSIMPNPVVHTSLSSTVANTLSSSSSAAAAAGVVGGSIVVNTSTQGITNPVNTSVVTIPTSLVAVTTPSPAAGAPQTPSITETKQAPVGVDPTINSSPSHHHVGAKPADPLDPMMDTYLYAGGNSWTNQKYDSHWGEMELDSPDMLDEGHGGAYGHHAF